MPSSAITTMTSIRLRWKRKARMRRGDREDGGVGVERARIEGEPAQRAPMLFGDAAEQHVQREPDRQIEDDADHRGGDGGERAGQPPVAAQFLDERRAGEDPQHRRHEGHPGGQRRAEQAGDQRRERRRLAEGGEEADELRHQDQRARRRLGKAERVDHFRRRHPAVRLDHLLRHIGQHRIGAAEGHHRELGEKYADGDEDMMRAEQQRGERRPAPTRSRARSPRRW